MGEKLIAERFKDAIEQAVEEHTKHLAVRFQLMGDNLSARPADLNNDVRRLRRDIEERFRGHIPSRIGPTQS